MLVSFLSTPHSSPQVKSSAEWRKHVFKALRRRRSAAKFPGGRKVEPKADGLERGKAGAPSRWSLGREGKHQLPF